MWSMLTCLRKKFQPSVRRKQILCRPRRVRPCLEVLEDRLVLDAYVFGGAGLGLGGDDTSWNDARNWLNQRTLLPGVPTAADDATIPNGFAVVISAGTAEVNSLGLNGVSTLTVSSSLTANGIGTTAGTTFTVTAGSPNPGQVTINQSGFFGGAVDDAGLITANSTGVDGTGVTFAGTTVIGPGDLNGNLNAGPNSSFTFAPSAVTTDTFVDGATLGPGSGSIIIVGPGIVDVDGDLLDNTMTIELTSTPTTSGTLAGTGSIDEWATFKWSGISTLSLAGGITVYNTFNADASSGNALQLYTTLTNEEFTTIEGSTGPDGSHGLLVLEPGGEIDNVAGTMTVSTPLILNADGGTGGITNSALGILDITGSEPVTIWTAFTNEGWLNVAGGSELDLATDPTFGAAPIDLEGKLFIDGTLALYSTATTDSGFILENDPGAFVIESGATLLLSGSASLIVQGKLEVTPTGLLTGGGTVYNSGRLRLDPFVGSSSSSSSSGGGRGHGTMGLGAYVQSNSGTLSIGVDPDTGDYTPLTVTGSAQLSGIVDLPGYVSAVGDSFTVVTAGALSGHFDSVPDGMVETDTSTSATVTQVNPPAGS